MPGPRRVLIGVAVVAATASGVAFAAPAAAECVSSGGTTVCGQGNVRGSNTGEGPGTRSGPVMPYPCTYDWYCDDDGFGITFGGW